MVLKSKKRWIPKHDTGNKVQQIFVGDQTGLFTNENGDPVYPINKEYFEGKPDYRLWTFGDYSGKVYRPSITRWELDKERIKREVDKVTYNSNIPEILHAVGEGALMAHPYTAFAYGAAHGLNNMLEGNILTGIGELSSAALFSPIYYKLYNYGSNLLNEAWLLANSNLYSNNKVINLYSTLARRYNLPDKARLPYLIRAIKSDNLKFTPEGDLLLNGDRFNHTNFTYDRKVVPHSSGSWDNSQLTFLINPREFIPSRLWGSIEPSDMFTLNDPTTGLSVPKKDVIIISGNPNVLLLANNKGIKHITSDNLNILEEAQISAQRNADLANRGKTFAFTKSDRHNVNRDYWDEVFRIQSKFGRPKVKDVRLLESITGMKSGILPISDMSKFRSLNYDVIMNTPINQIDKVTNNLPRFGNGRLFNYLKWSDYSGVQYPYKNFFYDPATPAEHNLKFGITYD